MNVHMKSRQTKKHSSQRHLVGTNNPRGKLTRDQDMKVVPAGTLGTWKWSPTPKNAILAKFLKSQEEWF